LTVKLEGKNGEANRIKGEDWKKVVEKMTRNENVLLVNVWLCASVWVCKHNFSES
jgi:hypothetical protein